MKTLTLTPSEIYRRKQRLWRAYCDFSERVRRAFFPDTSGVSLYLHNWYICAEKTKPAESRLARWIEDSTIARYYRLKAKLEADSVEREHKFGRHQERTLDNGWAFDPLWCPICNPSHAQSYGYELRAGKWVKINSL